MGILAWLCKALGGGRFLACVTRDVVDPVAIPADLTPAESVTEQPCDSAIHSEFGLKIFPPQDSDPARSIPVPYTPAPPKAARIFSAARALDALVDELDGKLFYSKIGGVTKRNKRGASRQKLIEELEDWTDLYLFPEPENRHSKCAIRVENTYGEQLGYVPEHVASEMTWQIARGHCYRCFVSEVTGWEYDIRGANIAILHWDPVKAARPERDFERFMSKIAELVGGQWFYAKLIGLTKSNEDGIRRREMFGTLQHKEQLGMIADGETREHAKYVYVCKATGEKLGALELRQSAKVLDAVVEGRRWAAFFRDCTEANSLAGFRPNIALLCFGAEASLQTAKNGRRWP